MNQEDLTSLQDQKEQVKPSIFKVLKQAELWAFIDWLVIPDDLREPKTQAELATKLGLEAATLSDWKKAEGFWEAVEKKRDEWGKDKTTNILQAFYKKVLKNPTAQDVQLWLTVFNGFKEVKGVEIEDKREQTNKLDSILARLMQPDDNEQDTTKGTGSGIIPE